MHHTARKIKFGYSFYIEAVDYLKKYVDFFKISSYNLWKELLKSIETNKPVIISTGMSNINELSQTIKFIKKFKNKKITILHCVSSYPAKHKYANLSVIKMLEKI